MPRRKAESVESVRMPANVKTGLCRLCFDNVERRVWTIEGAVSGDVCDGHLEVLVLDQNGKKRNVIPLDIKTA